MGSTWVKSGCGAGEPCLGFVLLSAETAFEWHRLVETEWTVQGSSSLPSDPDTTLTLPWVTIGSHMGEPWAKSRMPNGPLRAHHV